MSSRPFRSRSLLIVAALVATAVAAYGLIVRPIELRATQVQNLTLMRGYRRALETYRQQRGTYPDALRQAVRTAPVFGEPISIGQDMWGHSISYERLPDGFLLLSFGRDGEPDGTDYMALRGSTGSDESRCSDFNADQIFSDRGEHRTCGK